MIGDERRSVTVRVAGGSAHHPCWAIIGWVGFVLLCVAAGATTGTNRGTIADFWTPPGGPNGPPSSSTPAPPAGTRASPRR
jgi:hypothetical protein